MWCAQPYLCCGMHQLKRMSEILWGFETLLKGCQCLLGALGTGDSALYQAFLSTWIPTVPLQRSALQGLMLSRAGISSRHMDTLRGLCSSSSAGGAHSFLSSARCRTASSSAFELPSTHVSAGVRPKAEAEASGLFNAFSVTHCSLFLETRPVPHSVLLAEIQARARALPCACAL